MKALTLAIVLLIGSLANAGWSDPRIVFMEDGGTASFFALGEKVYLISCAHRTSETHVNVGDRVGYRCYDGSRSVATVAAVAPFDLDHDPVSDCAIYSFSAPMPPRVKPFKLSNRPLQRGEKVWVIGFPAPQQNYRCRTTTVISDADTLWLDGEATPGESGGPIITAEGELVGTLTATTNMGRTFCSGRLPATKLCKSFDPAWNCQGGACQQGYCPSGNCGQAIYTGPIYQPPNPQPPRQPLPPAPIATPPIAGPAGPQGPPGSKGPIGDKGPAGDKGPNGDAPSQTDIQNIVNVAVSAAFAKYELDHKAPTVDEIVTEVEKRRKPPRLRVVDPLGRFTTEYVNLKDGTDNDVIIEQRFTPAQ